MKVKHIVLKEDVSITFTPDEIWDLLLICESSRSYYHDSMVSYLKGSKGYDEYKRLKEMPERMQKKIIDIRNKYGVIEETEV